MEDGGFRHVPVVEKDGRIVSVMARGDFRGLEQGRPGDNRTPIAGRLRNNT